MGGRLLVSADPNPARGLRLVEVLADGTTNRIAGGGFTPPTISAIADQVTSPNTPVGPLAFTVGETESVAHQPHRARAVARPAARCQ